MPDGMATFTVLDGRWYPTSAGWLPGFPERDYHRGLMLLDYDGTETPEESLSYSRAKLLIPPSTPERFRGHVQKPSDELDFGKIAHRRVLGVGADYEVLPATGWKTKTGEEAEKPAATKEYKARKAEIEAAGRTPISEADMAVIEAMEKRLRGHSTALDYLTGDGDAEVSMWAQDPVIGCWLRGRVDYWNRARKTFVDYKTVGVELGAAPENANKTIYKNRYYLQAAWYLTLGLRVGIDVEDFVFILQEKDPPYQVSTISINFEFLSLGMDVMRMVIDRWAACMESGQWEGYPDEVVTVGPPPYAYSSVSPVAGLVSDELDAELRSYASQEKGI